MDDQKIDIPFNPLSRRLKRVGWLYHLVRACKSVGPDIRRGYYHLRRRPLIRAYLKLSQTHRLNVGCGLNPQDGWLNGDIRPKDPGVIFLDVTAPLPLADDSMEFVFSEHMIEHLDYEEGYNFLAECKRVLRPGGVLRVATPDLRKLTTLLEDSQELQWYVDHACGRGHPQMPATHAAAFNTIVSGWGHKMVYDEQTLGELLVSAGFEADKITPQKIGKSRHTKLCNMERHGQLPTLNQKINEFETMVLEAQA